ncbi:MAG: hypothetical protein JEZ04_11790 [Spirochaetales bacterium]|nr:hypothetical protein [Spirochaetales bacterium]
MKKVVLAVLFVILVLPVSVFSLSDDYGFTYGDWEIDGSRLYQNDVNVGIGKAWLSYPQEGVVEYRFNVRYEDGLLDDSHVGFGIHIFVDKPARGYSWGEGHSYLLWLNYDSKPVSDDIPAGLSLQIYRSNANWKMELLESVSLAELEKVIVRYPENTIVPFRIVADGRSGIVKLYDPVNESIYYPFKLDNKKALSGDYITLRTNSASFSFGY